MQFRFRGNSVQVLKVVDDPATGKSLRVHLGSINKLNLKLSEKLQESCSSEELEVITRWVERQKQLDDLKSELAAKTLPDQINKAAEWLTQADKDDAGLVASDIMTNWQHLRMVLKNEGLI